MRCASCGRPSARTRCRSISTYRSARMRCGFCNLFTRTGAPDELVERVSRRRLKRQAAVVRRALAIGGRLRSPRAAFGGGTPTFLDARASSNGCATSPSSGGRRAAFRLSVETSPETAMPDRLAVARRRRCGPDQHRRAELRRSGGARPSIARSSRPRSIARCARSASADPATLNIDLIYGLPGQTEATLAHLARRRARLATGGALPLSALRASADRRSARQRAGGGSTRFALAAATTQARAHLLAHGYEQMLDADVPPRGRPGRRTAPVYCCQNDGMIGLGCGARSYTRALHYSCDYAVGARGVRDDHRRWCTSDEDFARGRLRRSCSTPTNNAGA